MWGLIGCEPFEDGVVKALAAIEDAGLANVRLHADDARPVLKWLPAASLSRVFILFPIPGPRSGIRSGGFSRLSSLQATPAVMRPERN